MQVFQVGRRIAATIVFLTVAAFSFTVQAVPALEFGTSPSSTADHGQFEVLNQKFETGPQVTKACLSCHTEAAKQIHKTKHWTWDYENPVTGQRLGKRNVVNNFCISAGPNIAACSSCHVGYGWKDDSFDFAAQENVDCLVCHDTTGTYDKKALEDEDAKRRPNLKKIAQSIGRTSRETCGACHFAGGGAKAVKHGDIDPSLKHPDYFVDVHMDADGLDFACSTCHTSDQHALAGSRYAPTAKDTAGIDVPGHMSGGRASCESCHGLTPHPNDNHPKLNDHTDRVACQTCHIPEFSRGDFATKTWWDWSTAGKMGPDGNPLEKHDEEGTEIYNAKKGDFVWKSWVRPEYAWFNGVVRYTLPRDKIDPGSVVGVNRISGDAADPTARIWPFKVMRGKQPYDSGNNNLVPVKTTTKTGYWTTFDWPSAIEQGTQAMGLDYSGKFDFVETEMWWPIAHMVAPASEAAQCNECHTTGGRLADLTGFYMPGRDSFQWLTLGGWLAAAATLIGVLGHGLLRTYFALRRRTH